MLRPLISTLFCFISLVSIHSQIIDSVKFRYTNYECIKDSNDINVGKYYRHYHVKGIVDESNGSKLDFLVVRNQETTISSGDTTQSDVFITTNRKNYSLKMSSFEKFLEQINNDIPIENLSQSIDQSKLLKYLRSKVSKGVDQEYYESICNKMTNEDTIKAFFEINCRNSGTLGKRVTPCKENSYDLTIFYKDSTITYFSTSSDTYMQPYYRVVKDTVPRIPLHITNMKTNELISKHLIKETTIKELFAKENFYKIYREFWLEKWQIIEISKYNHNNK